MRRTNVLGLLVVLALFGCQIGFAGVLVSGDFKAGAPLFSGVESWAQTANPVFGAANIWNGLDVPYLPPAPGLTVAPFTNLLNSEGHATAVSFQFQDPVSAYNGTTSSHATDLFSDFVYLNGGTLSWQIDGLVPDSTAYLYFYGTNNVDSGIRGFSMTVQGANYAVSGYTGAYVAGIHVDGSGAINGTMTWTGGQASWSGFQLAGSAVPEPATLLLLPAGVLLLALRRRF